MVGSAGQSIADLKAQGVAIEVLDKYAVVG